MSVHPDHTTLQAAHAELDRYDRLAASLAIGDMAAALLRETLEELVRIAEALDAENGRLADLLLETTDGHHHTTPTDEVF